MSFIIEGFPRKNANIRTTRLSKTHFFFAYIIDIRPDPSPPIFKLAERKLFKASFDVFLGWTLFINTWNQKWFHVPQYIHNPLIPKISFRVMQNPIFFSLPVLWRMTSRSTTAATPLRSRREKNISAEGSVRGGRRREASRNFFQVKDSDVMQPERWPGDLSQFFALEVLEKCNFKSIHSL